MARIVSARLTAAFTGGLPHIVSILGERDYSTGRKARHFVTHCALYFTFEVGRIEISFEEVLGRLHSYARDCLRFAVELINAGFENKTKLLDLIDYSALRSELHQSMTSFLDRVQDAEQLKHELEYAERTPFCRTLHDERRGALH